MSNRSICRAGTASDVAEAVDQPPVQRLGASWPPVRRCPRRSSADTATSSGAISSGGRSRTVAGRLGRLGHGSRRPPGAAASAAASLQRQGPRSRGERRRAAAASPPAPPRIGGTRHGSASPPAGCRPCRGNCETAARDPSTRPGRSWPDPGRQAIQPRTAVQVLGRKLRRRAPLERQHAGQHLLVDDRQAVLIAVVAGPAVEQLRGGVDGRQPADDRALDVLQVLDQAEVGHLDPPAHQQQVLGLDVQVLQGMLLADVVQGVGGVAQIAPATRRGECRDRPDCAILLEEVLQARRWPAR